MSVLEQMADRGPRILQTLPSEGLVLEEIIGDMREEYGYPTTPQEYRLTVRVAPDEAERHAASRQRRAAATATTPVPEVPPAAEDEVAPEAGEGDQASPARRGRLRRRRRGRSRGAGAAGLVAGGDAGGGGEGGGGADPASGEGQVQDGLD